jgi:uncharacterized RmlC-like cupin family protein
VRDQFLTSAYSLAQIPESGHHHGEAETAIDVVSGNRRFVFLENGEEVVLETRPGEYVFVSPYVPHREENPSPDTPAVVVIARSAQEGSSSTSRACG